MTGYIVQRLIQTLIVIFLVTIIIFLLMRLLPGDPVFLYLSQDQLASFTPEQVQEVRHQLGLDLPMWHQYINWIGGIFQGDWGESWAYKFDVWTEMSRRLPITAYLGSLALILSALIGIPLGLIAAVRRGKWADTVATILANLGITAPVFWLGILGMYFFGLYLNLLPTFGFTSPVEDLGQSLKQTIMPVFCLAVFSVGSLARQTRSSLLEVIQQDYIRTAWSKGLKERTIIIRHALKNSLIPVITLLGISVRNIVGGAVLVETVFSIPGMGRLVVDAMIAKDYSTVQGVILITAVVVCLANLVVDIAYSWLDPRIRLG